MMHNRIRTLLLSDIDGTLVGRDKHLSAATLQAAASLKAAGIRLALTSARPPAGMRMFVEPLALDTPIAGFNGGLIVEPDMRPLARHPLSEDAIAAAISLTEREGLDVWIYTEDGWFAPSADAPHVAREAWLLDLTPGIRRSGETWPSQPVFKIVGVSDDMEAMATAESLIQAKLGETASVSRSEPHFIDVTAARAVKGGVVDALSALLDIAPEQIATIGDMPNDVSMFERSGLAIAMGNAPAAVQARADIVTASNENDGWARAVADYVLPWAAALQVR